jgi:PAS domain S-box-containing protein
MGDRIEATNSMSTAALERAKALSAAENRTIGMIANGVPLPHVLDELCRAIDALTPGVLSTVLLMDPDGKRLWPGGGPRFPAALQPAINPWMVGPGRGACGTAAFLKARVIIADVTTDPRWPDEYRALAVSHGLRASWSQPLITSAGDVLGTFAMYYEESRVPDPADLELIEAAGQIALIAIQLERSQAALRESEGLFRPVVNTISVMIWTSDADGQWTYLNHAWNVFAGRAGTSQTASLWAEAIHPADAGRSVEVYARACDRRMPFEMEYRLRRNDGVYRWIFDQAVPRFHADGSFAGYIGSAIDVTERKFAAEALSTVSRRLIDAQEAGRTRLARELHDDINQRLTLVSMSLSRLQPGSLDAGEFRAEIAAASAQVTHLVQDIQALSHRLHSSKLDLLGLTRAAGDLCAELSDVHGVAIDFHTEHIGEGLPDDVSLCLFRVLQEALQNATKHSRSRQIDVSLRRGEHSIELAVVDAGVGFDPRAAKAHGLGLTSMTERLNLRRRVADRLEAWGRDDRTGANSVRSPLVIRRVPYRLITNTSYRLVFLRKFPSPRLAVASRAPWRGMRAVASSRFSLLGERKAFAVQDIAGYALPRHPARITWQISVATRAPDDTQSRAPLPRVAQLEIDAAVALDALCVLEVREHVLRRLDHKMHPRSERRIGTAGQGNRPLAIQLRRTRKERRTPSCTERQALLDLKRRHVRREVLTEFVAAKNHRRLGGGGRITREPVELP